MTALSTFYPLVATDCPGAPYPLIDDAVVRAAREFCKSSHAYTAASLVTTIAGDADYNLVDSATHSQLFALELEPVAINFVRRTATDFLNAQTPEYIDSMHNGGINWVDGTPTDFSLNEDGIAAFVRFYPRPTGVESLTCDLSLMPLSTATALPDALAEPYFEGILAYAKYWLMIQVGKPWSNPDKAATSYRQFDAKVADAMVRKFQGRVNGVRHVRMVPFA